MGWSRGPKLPEEFGYDPDAVRRGEPDREDIPPPPPGQPGGKPRLTRGARIALGIGLVFMVSQLVSMLVRLLG